MVHLEAAARAVRASLHGSGGARFTPVERSTRLLPGLPHPSWCTSPLDSPHLRHGAAGVDALGLLGVDSKHEHLLELHAAAPGAVAARRRQGPRRVQALELALVDLEGPGSHTRRGRREGLRVRTRVRTDGSHIDGPRMRAGEQGG